MVRGCPYYRTALPENEKAPCAAEKQCSIQTNATKVSWVSLLWKWYPKYLLWAWRGERKERRFPHDGAVAVHSYSELCHPACPWCLSTCSTTLHQVQLPSSKQTPPHERGCEEVERPRCGAADEGDAALAAGEYEPAVCFSVFAWEIRESEAAITLQARLQLQQLLHNEGCSESTALLKLLLNEKLCHMLYVMVHVPVENACNDTYCNGNDVVAVFGLRKSVINRVYCWCISTVFANGRSHSEL